MQTYFPLLMIMLVGITLPTLFTLGSYLLGPKKYSDVKALPFEAGMEAKGDAKSHINIKFYLVAMAFLVFDVEIVFFYPWASIFNDNSLYGLLIMIPFVTLLLIGFIYDWKKGALEWE